MLAASFNDMFARLEKNFEAARQFTADASHELRTPTAVILAQAEYALELADSMEEYQESMEVVQRQAMRMRSIIDQLLLFSRLDQGTQRPTLEETDLSELLTQLCDEQQLLAENSISLTAEIAPDITIWTDRNLFTRTVTNLISNAYRYGKPNGHIWVTLRRDGQHGILSIKDDGIGIAPENQERIFERFFQVDSSATRIYSGSGLGLALVREYAVAQGYTVTVESVLGEGSAFTVRIPVAAVVELDEDE